MPTGFALNRPRLQLTGLEEPEELWDRLKEALAELQRLAAVNKKLHARLAVLERQVSEVGGLTDDELVAELPKRMGRALDSAQGVAKDIVRRARKNEAVIRQNAVDAAASIVSEAEAQAAKHIRKSVADAADYIAKAEADASEIVGSAQRRRKEILAQMQDEVLTLQQRLNVLRRDQARVIHAYDIVERTVAEARRALHQGEAVADLKGPMPAEEEPQQPTAPPRRSGRKPVPLRAAVYDWSPAATNAG